MMVYMNEGPKRKKQPDNMFVSCPQRVVAQCEGRFKFPLYSFGRLQNIIKHDYYHLSADQIFSDRCRNILIFKVDLFLLY